MPKMRELSNKEWNRVYKLGLIESVRETLEEKDSKKRTQRLETYARMMADVIEVEMERQA